MESDGKNLIKMKFFAQKIDQHNDVKYLEVLILNKRLSE